MKRARRLLMILLGNFILATAVELFIVPAALVSGGTTGIALTVNHFLQIPISVFSFIFNMIMLAIGYLVLGKEFAMTTIFSSCVYPAIMYVYERVLPGVALSDDVMLNTVLAGIGVGLAIGLVIREGASTGGMDIPPLVFKHFFNWNISVTMYLCDLVILLLQLIYSDTERILYGIIMLLITSIVIEKVTTIGASRTELKVVSDKNDEICDAILKKADRGVTLLDSIGGYTREGNTTLFTVVSNREVFKVEKLIHEIDPYAFVVITKVSEVRGRGFSLDKKENKAA